MIGCDLFFIREWNLISFYAFSFSTTYHTDFIIAHGSYPHIQKDSDFSVVLFRSDFVLVSEKNHVKMHKNQCVRTMPCSPEGLSGATNRGHTMAPEAQTPSQWPDMGRPHRHVGLQLLENKALSWGTIRKSACILAAITIRNSQMDTLQGTAWLRIYRTVGFQVPTLISSRVSPCLRYLLQSLACIETANAFSVSSIWWMRTPFFIP